MSSAFPLPANLPEPQDDRACRHLTGMRMPRIHLPSTAGRMVDLGELSSERTVIYCYPMTGVPGKPLPDGWDAIPGARGCTPQSCSFRDHFPQFRELGVEIFGLSTQSCAYQREMAARLGLPFEVLSDANFAFCEALQLPTFEAAGMRLIKRLTIVARQGLIEMVFYPVFPPDKSGEQVLAWLGTHPL